LHEVGISIAYSSYHKHSAYILQNADMPGFSRMDQAHLALIVQAHRGSLAKAQAILVRPADMQLALVLRLAVVLSRGRGGVETPSIRLIRRDGGFELVIERAWLEHHPLSETALDEEVRQWQSLGVYFRLKQFG
jgi:exopolyphosphatase/guanosine-5'-triphosphate,3'-diphosphate pyrophosphatase